jgi:hypothetical protein
MKEIHTGTTRLGYVVTNCPSLLFCVGAPTGKEHRLGERQKSGALSGVAISISILPLWRDTYCMNFLETFGVIMGRVYHN